MQQITHRLVRDFSCEWCKNWDARCDDELDKWISVVQAANLFIEGKWKGSDPSPFKRAAAIAMGIVAQAPIDEHIPQNVLEGFNLQECSFAGSPYLLRAVVADSFARFVLVRAEVGKSQPLRVLTEPIKTSSHFRNDVLWLLTQVKFTNGGLFNPLALIYEACAYQTNPNAQDKH